MAQTESTSYWSGLRNDLTGLAIDIVRARHIDVEQFGDGDNLTDQADVRAGFTGQDSFVAAPGGIPITTWLLIGAAVAGGVIVFKKFL